MSKLGLKSKTVKLVKYSNSWTIEFERERDQLSKLLKNEIAEIYHIGSTAIKGISAKPIIDIALGVRTIRNSKNKIKRKLELSKYVQRNFRNPNQHLLFSKIINDRTTHHVHLIRYKGKVWKRLVIFRDHLNANPKLVQEYTLLKKKLANQFVNDRLAYTKAKRKFINKVLKKANYHHA